MCSHGAGVKMKKKRYLFGEFEENESPRHKPEENYVFNNISIKVVQHELNENRSDSEDIQIRDSKNEDTDLCEMSLRERIIHHLSISTIPVKSQQRGEPDLTCDERKIIISSLLNEKPGQFLFRFGQYLNKDHLQYFVVHEGNPEVDHYLAETMKILNRHTSKIIIRNRRYAALQKLRSNGDYFSEKEMERREPLLYDQLIAKHLTDDEKEGRNTIDKSDLKLTSILLEHIDMCDEKDLKKQQECVEDDMREENDEDDDEETYNMEVSVESGEKQLLREEFYSSVYHDFLSGADKEFNYSDIDQSADYDLLDVQARDEEERYFDEDDD